ncbi:MAG: hypothetical protein AVDCRST_MAG35-846 [uncultured Quadrisphaera sp.]|uniref:DUF4235 domain-containing protein n=1 Tax=uncultured Quadrisphaera sp. TaxID=904978 RepID=A0A6J4NXB1_9ACTN|nr:MAG: hypothetical protein AVDCRST_MAG35-846 [uncultured Quadrisphaera sp.]
MGGLVWKVLGFGSKIFGRTATNKLATTIWRRATGKNPPLNPMSPTTTWAEATAWAIITGALSGLSAMVLTRQAAKYYRTSTGHLPKGLEDS